ncbi:hypothetical protein [Agathobaculum sp.]|uniref:hypothetical protein n=1 Tax=Agathobaculum sp. TaxID=2048138 RepID=UPI00307CAFF3
MADKIFIATLENQEKILDELRGQRPKRYGYRVKISEPDTSARVEYIYDAVGMTPAFMDFAAGAFNYGSWRNVWFVRDNYPCMVRADGTEDYRLDPNNYNARADGSTAATDISNTAYNGNVMAAIPLVWVKRYQEDGYQYVIFCETQYDEGYKAYAHTRADGTIAKVAYHAAFKGGLVSDKLRSLKDLWPENNTNAQQEMDYAKANGANWCIRTWSLHELISDLLTLISKNMNAQAAFGSGCITGYVDDASKHYGMTQCGSLCEKGQFFGYGPADTTHQVKVFHIEGFWGERWDRLAGLVYDMGEWKAKMTAEGGGYNFTGAGYTAACAGVPHAVAESFGGWQRDTYQSELGRLPTGQVTGSETTFESDFTWLNNTICGVVLAGADCGNGWGCGPRYLNGDYAAGAAWWSVGASLSLV